MNVDPFFVPRARHPVGPQPQVAARNSDVVPEEPSAISLGGDIQEEPSWDLLSYDDLPAEEQDAAAKYARKCLVKLPPADRKGETPPVMITSLPIKDSRNPIWAENPCLRCAKAVGTRHHYCARHGAIGKCIRCYNLGLACVPIPEEFKTGFKKLQRHWQSGEFSKALVEREAWQHLTKSAGVKTPSASPSKQPMPAPSTIPSADSQLLAEVRSLREEARLHNEAILHELRLQREEARLHTNALLRAVSNIE